IPRNPLPYKGLEICKTLVQDAIRTTVVPAPDHRQGYCHGAQFGRKHRTSTIDAIGRQDM
ncbi:hypothetical protein, partial [Alicyclobacillus hesperidum]|uniref:hypothetical protein n=1 Tax=Alicyclobacillus hesperidum TaxID=89784 RepID=UPI001ED8C03A